MWAPKYRKKILVGVVGERMRELLLEIADAYEITVDELEVRVDHVPIFCSFPPKFSITQVVTRLKSMSARAIFREHPQVKRQLWASANFGQAPTLGKRQLWASANFGQAPTLGKRQLWGGEFWEDGYFARTVGDKVTAEVIKKYIRNHRDEKEEDLQLKLFDK